MAVKAKAKCAISREQFAKDAPVLEGVVSGMPLLLEPKEFSTGSLGWHANPKVTVEINGVRVPCQASVLLTIIGSKDLPQ